MVPPCPSSRAAVIGASRALLCGLGMRLFVKSPFCAKRKSIELPLFTAVIYKHKGAFMSAHPTGHMASFLQGQHNDALNRSGSSKNQSLRLRTLVTLGDLSPEASTASSCRHIWGP